MRTQTVSAWDKSLARAVIDSLRLDTLNWEVAEYWLSLWSAAGPPRREQFEPRRLKDHLPAIAIFEVMPDGPVICRLAGTFVEAALGHDLTGHDLLEFTPPAEREQRIENTRMIVAGAISHGLRQFRNLDGSETVAAEIALPFDGETELHGHRYLFHSAWRPKWYEQEALVSRPTHAGLGSDQRIMSIRAVSI